MTQDDARETITYRYRFQFGDGQQREFTVALDRESLEFLPASAGDRPSWTALGFHQCENCPLRPEQSPHCPVAVNVVELIETFAHSISHQEVQVTVQSKSRTYQAQVPLQKGLGAVLGLIMVTSGCPILDRLRPMVETHLPFMTLEESTFRIISTYLTAQYFRATDGQDADWQLNGLVDFLKELDQVNRDFCERLRAIRVKDASLNAVVNLNTTSGFTGIALSSTWLDRLKAIFREHAGW